MNALQGSAVPGAARMFWFDRVSLAKLLVIGGLCFVLAVLGAITWTHYARSADEVIPRSRSLLDDMTIAAERGQPEVVLALARDIERERSGLRVRIFADDGRDLLGGNALAGSVPVGRAPVGRASVGRARDVIEWRPLIGPRTMGWWAVTAVDRQQLLGSTARWFATDGLVMLLCLATLAALTIWLGGWLAARRMRAFGARFGVTLPMQSAEDSFGPLEDSLRNIVRRANDGEARLKAAHRRADDHRRMLTRAVEQSASEILLIDPTRLSITYANTRAQQNLQFETDVSQQGLDLRDIAVLDDELKKDFTKLIAGESAELRWCISLRRRDGTQYRATVVSSIVGDGDERAVLMVARDITAQARLEDELRASKERNALVVQASRDGICDIDMLTDEVYVSTQCAIVLGYDTAEEFLAAAGPTNQVEYLLDLIHPDDRMRVQTQHEAYLNHEVAVFDAEYRCRTRTHVYRWLHARGQAIWNDDGMPTRYALCLSDVTQRKISEALLQDTVSRLGAVLQHVAEGIITLDHEGRIRSFNPAAERIFGWTQEEILDLPITTIVPLATTVSGLPLDSALRTLKDRDDCIGVRRDGSTMPIEINASRMIVAKAEMYTALVRDVSERRRVEIELRHARDTAEAGSRAKSEFLAMMSHEVRTPLNGVLGMAQLLFDMQLTPAQDETVRTIQRSGEVLLSILNDLLDFSKIEAGQMRLENVPFDVGFAVREVLDLLTSATREQAVEVIVDYAADVPRRVIGDQTRFRQILLNLCGNALKFTSAGHVAVTVSVASRVADIVRLRVAVEDTGIGIDASVQSRLFEPFVQADASTTRRFGGTGLGLAICRQLIDLMGGTLTLTSTLDVGSEFAFVVGCRVAPDDQPGLPVPIMAARRAALLVPYARTATVVARDLARLGFNLTQVATLDDALAIAADVLVLDIAAVHDMDQTVTALGSSGRLAHTLLLTSGAMHNEHARLAARGFGAVTAKPLHAGALESALSQLGVAMSVVVPNVINDSSALETKVVVTEDAVAASANAMAVPSGECDVLIVEDNHINQRVARRMLESLGCRVHLANNGREALALWRQREFALIFMDVRMPEIDGYEATRTIRADELRRGCLPIPIVAMTANAEASDERECRAAGMSDFLSKPIKVADLQRMLEVWSVWRRQELSAASRTSVA